MQNKILLDNYIKINDYVELYIPTVREVYKNEDDYYLLSYHLTAMPFYLCQFHQIKYVDLYYLQQENVCPLYI